MSIAVGQWRLYSRPGNRHALVTPEHDAVVLYRQPTAKSAGDNNIVSRFRGLDSVAPRKGSNQIWSE
jgi:hypothetical protein